MSEQSFLNSIFDLAARVKGTSLTSNEQTLIRENFNKSTGSAYERASEAIEDSASGRQ